MTPLDYAALALFFLCWLGYDPLLKLLAHRTGTLNDDMTIVRKVWMTAMTHREIRLVDSQLMGHSINSASFFASTNLLLIAAVASVLFGGEQALQGFASVGAADTPIKLLEGKPSPTPEESSEAQALQELVMAGPPGHRDALG